MQTDAEGLGGTQMYSRWKITTEQRYSIGSDRCEKGPRRSRGGSRRASEEVVQWSRERSMVAGTTLNGRDRESRVLHVPCRESPQELLECWVWEVKE